MRGKGVVRARVVDSAADRQWHATSARVSERHAIARSLGRFESVVDVDELCRSLSGPRVPHTSRRLSTSISVTRLLYLFIPLRGGRSSVWDDGARRAEREAPEGFQAFLDAPRGGLAAGGDKLLDVGSYALTPTERAALPHRSLGG